MRGFICTELVLSQRRCKRAEEIKVDDEQKLLNVMEFSGNEKNAVLCIDRAAAECVCSVSGVQCNAM